MNKKKVYRTFILSWLIGLPLVVSAGDRISKVGFELKHNKDTERIDILYDRQLITSYLYADSLEKPVLYPLRTVEGIEVTRGYPLAPRINERTDHPHHVGVWFNFGDVNGLDFWNNSSSIPSEKKKDYGSIRHRAINLIENGKENAKLTVEADWVNHSGEILLREKTHYLFMYKNDLLSIERITQLIAIADTVLFKDNKEGLFAIRVAREFEELTDKPDFFIAPDGLPSKAKISNNGNANGVYRNSEGLKGGDVWGKPASWVALSAEKEGIPITIAILDHPENPAYPAYSHARGYGLFSVNNLGRQVFDKEQNLIEIKLKKDEQVCFKHKIVIKSGKFATDEELTALFFTYAK